MAPVSAIASSTTPPPGSAERKAILDAARIPVEKELAKPVQFVVENVRALDGWAFLQANMQGVGGQPISYADTRFQEAAEHGLKSDAYVALLEKQADGTWVARTWRIGPTDVAWADWSKQYHAPAALFPALGE